MSLNLPKQDMSSTDFVLETLMLILFARKETKRKKNENSVLPRISSQDCLLGGS